MADSPDMRSGNYCKPRVLVLATTLPAVPDDGTPQFVLDLSLRLQKSFDVCIVAPRMPLVTIRGAGERRPDPAVSVFTAPLESLADGAILPNIKARPATAVQARS